MGARCQSNLHLLLDVFDILWEDGTTTQVTAFKSTPMDDDYAVKQQPGSVVTAIHSGIRYTAIHSGSRYRAVIQNMTATCNTSKQVELEYMSKSRQFLVLITRHCVSVIAKFRFGQSAYTSMQLQADVHKKVQESLGQDIGFLSHEIKGGIYTARSPSVITHARTRMRTLTHTRTHARTHAYTCAHTS